MNESVFPSFVLAGSNGIHVESQIPCIYLCIDLALANNSLGTFRVRLSLGHPIRYQYMENLPHLGTCRPTGEAKQLICTGTGTLPLRWQEWDSCLSLYPDQRLTVYVVDGIYHGFHVGYDQEATSHSSRGNMKSSLENPHVIGEYLHVEFEAGRVIDPLDLSSHLQVHTSRFGVIPKSAP